MAGLLIRMRLALLRRSMSGQRAVQIGLGALVGLGFAGLTAYLAGVDFPVSSTATDVMAVVFGLWLVGWLFGPILFGSGSGELTPAQLALFPIPPRSLALGLLGASMIGVGPLVTVLAFLSLVIFAAPLGFGAVVVAIPALVLLLGFVVLLSKVVGSLRGQVVRSRLGAALSGLISAILMTLSTSLWAVNPAVEQALSNGFSPVFSGIVRWLPSGWAPVAVSAAGSSDWGLALAALAGLLVLDGLLVVVWARLLSNQLSARRTSGGRIQVSKAPASGFAATPVGGVVFRELRTWRRDTTRINYFFFAVFFGLLFAVAPLLGGASDFLPWTGLLVVGWLAAMSANLYGSDGTSLWTTLVAPHGERVDLRGRQIAWLAVTAPVVLVLDVVFTAISGATWAWPWVLGLSAAALGGGAGIITLVGVYLLVPMRDPAKRGTGTMDNSTDFIQVITSLVLLAVSVVPTGLVLVYVNPWVGVLVGLLSAVAWPYLLGKLAIHRLHTAGPDLLMLMRSGHRPTRAAVERPTIDTSELPKFSPGVAVALGLLVICWIPLVPQGIIPAVLKLNDSTTTSWFLALYLPDAFQWPVIAMMIALGLGLLIIGLVQAKKRNLRPGPPRGEFARPKRNKIGAL